MAKTELSQYFKEISKRLLCKRGVKRQFLIEFQSSVQDYIDKRPEVTLEDVRSHFGAPEEIANEFLASIELGSLKKAFGWKRVLIIGLCVALLLLTLYIVASLIDGHLAVTGFHETEVALHPQ